MIELGDERRDLGLGDARGAGLARAFGFPRAEQRAMSPGHKKQMPTGLGPAAERVLARLAARDQIHRLHHGRARRPTERTEQPVDGGPRRVDRNACGDLHLAPALPIDSADAADTASLDNCAHRVDVVGEHGTVFRRGQGKRERQPIGLGGDVVVPDRRAGQSLQLQSRESLNRVASGHHASRRQLQGRRHVTITVGGDQAVQQKAGTHRVLAPGQGSRQRKREP